MKDCLEQFSSGYTGSIRRVCYTAGAGEKRFTETKIIFARNKNPTPDDKELIRCARPSQTPCDVSVGATYSVATVCSGLPDVSVGATY